MDDLNTRILVIDDEESVRDSFLHILVPASHDSSELDAAEAALFEDEPVSPSRSAGKDMFRFLVDTASTGEAGVRKVKEAHDSGEPYAVVFCDMRMPGQDGLGAVKEIRQFDQRCEVIFVTAYTDYTIEEIVEEAGSNVSYFCKPFAAIEIRQLATKAVYDWNRSRSLERIISILTNLRGSRGDIDQLLQNILLQVGDLLGPNSAMIAQQNSDGDYEMVIATGKMLDEAIAAPFLKEMASFSEKEVLVPQKYYSYPMKDYRIMVVFEPEAAPLNLERTYIIRLFLEQASEILENASLQEALYEKEKLSLVGKALGMAAHDMRGPVGAIRSASELLDLEDTPEMRKEAQSIILECVDLSLSLINDILDFIKDRPVETESLELEGIMDRLKKLVDPFLKDSAVAYHVEVPEGLRVEADGQKLIRVLFNLVKNASESFPLGKKDEAVVRVIAEPKGDQVLVSVSDNGPGISKDILPRLFDPFATSGKAAGSGLGLPIVRQIVEKHGSQIDVESGPEGTRFQFLLKKGRES